MSPALASLVKAIDKQSTASEAKSEAFVVLLPADAAAHKPQLEEFAAKEKITVPLTVAVSYPDVEQKFKVKADDAMPINVLIYRDKKVKQAFTFNNTKEIKDADLKAVQAAIVANSK